MSLLTPPGPNPEPTSGDLLSARPWKEPAVLRGAVRPDLLRNEVLGDILAEATRSQPSQAALIEGERGVTYEELSGVSNCVASALHRRGATAGRVFGLLLPRGADLLIAQAGITKSGAAWLPFDAETPLERVKTCLAAAQATGLIVRREWLPKTAGLPVPVWAIEDLLESREPLVPLPPPKPSDPAYVIFTSGSTGQPKGIVISHRSICHFLRSENSVLGVSRQDRVYQGFSIAFDMSFEEIWISYLAGATLWIAPSEVVKDPVLLAQALAQHQITVWHAVPTLAALIPEVPPTVRLINLGGEACPEALARRLVRPGRKVFNTYGPTEASVSASVAELQAGQPVSIGWPLPNYGLLVLDAQRRPLPPGEVGELCIFGPGLAVGYLGRPELTAGRFIANPLAQSPEEERLYLTGDLARLDPGGPVHCLGRVDNQVKVRGFRVELEEISTALASHPGVAAAAAVLRPLADIDHVVGFLVPAPNAQIHPADLRRALAARLPSYMVPAHFETVAELPRLASGKVDLQALRAVPLKTSELLNGTGAEPRNEEEMALFQAIRELMPACLITHQADFFDDLGGHSLLAARLVSRLRARAAYELLGVQDVYRERNLDSIARQMNILRGAQRARPSPPRAVAPWHRRFLCGLAQGVIIPAFVLLHIADWLAPFFVYHYFTGDEGDSVALAIGYSLATFVVAQAANFVLAIAGKRLIAGPLRPGRYPLWGVTYFRWWLGSRFCELPDTHLLAGTPWLPLYLRALGARIGKNVLVETISVAAPELLRIEDGASLGTLVHIENARVEGGQLVTGPVRIGREAVVDSYAVLENDTAVAERARLCGQSALAAGRVIPAGEIWDGAPARPAQQRFEELPPRPTVGPVRHWMEMMGFALTSIAVSVLFFLPTFPAFILIDWLDVHTWNIFDAELHPLITYTLFFLLGIPASALFAGLTILATAGLRRLVPPLQAGRYSVHSFGYWRRKFVSFVLERSLLVLHGLYASVYAPLWLRLLGVRVGRHAEVSTAEGMTPELLSLGDDCFIADGVLLGDEEQRGGWMILKPTRIGNRSFVGNGAYVPDGAAVPDDVLIGVQTRTPRNDQLKSGQTWMGSPPLLLPARERLVGFPESLTFRPSGWRRLGRGTIEGLRLVLPLAVMIATGYMIVMLVMPLAEERGWGAEVALALSLAGCLYGLGSFVLVIALKWLLVGRYRPRAAPMWTPFVWLSEAVTNLYESLAVPNFLDLLRGTPMLPWALRLLGVRIGQGVFLNTTDITEFDCVRIGSHSELNAWSGPQTHLFEDRVMKIGTVEIGGGVSVGSRSTILYDSRVGAGARLGPLTLVAKGETIPEQTQWQGTPATPG